MIGLILNEAVEIAYYLGKWTVSGASYIYHWISEQPEPEPEPNPPNQELRCRVEQLEQQLKELSAQVNPES